MSMLPLLRVMSRAAGIVLVVAATGHAQPADGGATLAPAPDGGVAPLDGAAKVAAAPAHAPAREGQRAGHVIIISEDGLRPDFASNEHLHWHQTLCQHGSYSWKAKTIRDASTLPAHAAMLSGVDVDAHGLSWNNWRPSKGYIKVRTIFDEATAHGLKTAMFVGKSKLKHIATPGTVDVFDRPGYYCKKVADAAAEYIKAEKPALGFVHFSDPDEVGHAKGWGTDDYTKAAARADKCLGVVLEALDEAGLTDDTLVILTADHGGHNHVHSGALLIDREIPWIARGPGVRVGHRIHAPISTVDTAATALYALGLPISSSLIGKPVMEIFSDAKDTATP